MAHTWTAQQQAAEALGLFEDRQYVPYTIYRAFNISMPPEFKVLNQTERAIAWQGDRIQPLEVMSAAAKVTTYSTLAEALGSNITAVGERLAAKRPWGTGAQCVNASQDPANTTLDTYIFEFVGDRIHEFQLFSILQRGSEKVLCNVALRTPPMVWVDKQETFNKILATFTPLEPQVAAAAAVAAATASAATAVTTATAVVTS